MITKSSDFIRLARWKARAVCVLTGIATACYAAGTGSIHGVISDNATKSFLQGAAVSIDGTSRTYYTDRRGEFEITELAPGDHHLAITYTGMAPADETVTVADGRVADVSVGMSSDVILMGSYSVMAHRSADAIATTVQKESPNIKNVVDIASYGRLANGNPAELLQLLPGVSGNYFGSQVDRVYIRGINSSLNSVTVDGGPLAGPDINVAASQRDFVLYTTSTNNIKTMEVIKALTPNMDADAIGGTVNMVQRGGLDYPSDAPHFNATVGGQTLDGKSGYHTNVKPTAELAYHNVYGANRTWGVYLDAGFTTENINDYFTIPVVTGSSALGGAPYPFLWIEAESLTLRRRRNGAATFEWRPSDQNQFTLKYKHDEWHETGTAFFRQMISFDPVVPTTPGILKYNSGTAQDVIAPNPADVWTDTLSFEGKHSLKSDWSVNYLLFSSRTRTNIDARNDKYGTAVAQFKNPFSYQLDGRSDPAFPTFSITSSNAADFNDLNNYTLPVYQQVNFHTLNESYLGKVDVSKLFEGPNPFKLSFGGAERQQARDRHQDIYSRSYIGPDGVAGTADDNVAQFRDTGTELGTNTSAGNRRFPVLDITAIARNFHAHPDWWSENAYSDAVNSLNSNFKVQETIRAGYTMGNWTAGNWNLLGGVRMEQTDVKGRGVFTNPTPASATDIPDPIARAHYNYGTRTSYGSYRDFFPSLHAVYSWDKNTRVRASYTTGIGRPGWGDLTPNTSVDVTTRSVSTGNPNLKPQYANNFDLSFERYIDPAGLITVGLFYKDIKDFITPMTGTVQPGSGIGSNDQYAGYALHTSANGGSATVRGAEFNYVQQLRFIPQAIGLFTLKGNLTVLSTQGDYGKSGASYSSGEIAGFVPRSYNVILQYSFKRFNALVRYNYQGVTLVSRGSDDRFNTYFKARHKVDLNLSYAFNERYSIYVAIDNLTRQRAEQYIGRSGTQYAGMTFAPVLRTQFGVNAAF